MSCSLRWNSDKVTLVIRSNNSTKFTNMWDLFVSYAREDTARVMALTSALGRQGWSLFTDHAIPTGQTWREYLGTQLESSRCILVAWSKTSVKSRWVQEEADEGFHRGVLIPVLLESVTPPLGFRSLQAADLSGWQGDDSSESFRQLTDDITRILELSAPQDGVRRISGIWEGDMYQDGSDPFNVRLVLTAFNVGQVGGSIEHRTLRARGTLTCIKQTGKSYYYEQHVDYGTDACFDGMNKVVLLDDDTLERTWYWPETEKEGAKGTLRRVR